MNALLLIFVDQRRCSLTDLIHLGDTTLHLKNRQSVFNPCSGRSNFVESHEIVWEHYRMQ
jgi:hypothetical protein